MKSKRCPSCGADMKRNGKTSSGAQRWRCKACGASCTHRIDSSAKELSAFLAWLFSKGRQADMPGQGRTFRRRAERFWAIWPVPEADGEVHRVVYVDGIYLARDLVVLIACTDEHVVGWHMARSENSRSWEALMGKVAPPEVVVTDGGSGFEKARREAWPATRVQRCVFHAFCQVKRYTTTRPKLQAGIELYALARDLLSIETPFQSQLWVERLMQWCEFWNDFLQERSVVDGRKVFTHDRLRKARRGLVKLVNAGTLFTYLDPALCAEGPLPSTTNRIEGGINAQLRAMVREHRGLSDTRRAKAVFWWCYMHTECPLPAARILEEMPTDDDIDALRDIYGIGVPKGQEPVKWGDGIVWEEFHHRTRWPYSVD